MPNKIWRFRLRRAEIPFPLGMIVKLNFTLFCASFPLLISVDNITKKEQSVKFTDRPFFLNCKSTLLHHKELWYLFVVRQASRAELVVIAAAQTEELLYSMKT